MNKAEKDRIQNAIRQIQTSLDVDPWAMEQAVKAMKRDLPQKPTEEASKYYENLSNLCCPNCEAWIGIRNRRLKCFDMYNNTNRYICVKCGQVLDLNELDDENAPTIIEADK